MRRARGCCRPAGVPPEWRVEKVGRRVVLLRVGELLLATVQVVRNVLTKGGSYDTYLWVAFFVGCLGMLVLLQRLRPRPRLFELVELVHSATWPMLLLTTNREASVFNRYRTEVLLLGLAIIPGLATSMRWRLYATLVGASVLSHSVALLVFNRSLEPLGVLLMGALANLSAGGALLYFAGEQLRMLRDFYEAERELRQEKDASESLLSMLCDATVVFAGDADTVLECDGRFGSIMGTAMQGQRISDFIESNEDARRQLRQLQAALAGAAVCETPSPVTALPISFQAKTGGRVQLTLYAVGHRLGADAARRYVVGVVQQGESQPLPQAGGGVAADRLKEAGLDLGADELSDEFGGSVLQVQGQRLGSEAPTTRTGALFRPFYLMGDVADLDVGKAFDQLAELGRKEHWLVEPRELEVCRAALASGGFGSVHDATLCGAPVVVKLVKDSFRKGSASPVAALLNELRVLRHCRHPNLVELKGAVVDAQLCRVGLVLESLPRGNLERWIKTRWAIDTARFRVLVGVCRALWFLHTRSPCITHGDLKPSNVLIAVVGRDETAKVLDFGLSRLHTFERSGIAGGTLRWMAPEQLEWGAQCTPAGDAFAFGRLIHYLVTGLEHYEGASPEAVRADLRSGRPRPALWPEAGRPLQEQLRPQAEACLRLEADQRPTMIHMHGVLSALPTEQFDDQTRSARRMVCPGAAHVPWHEAVEPAMDIIHSSRDEEGRGRSASPPQSGDVGQSSVGTCRAARLGRLLECLAAWHVEVSGASCCGLHTVLWQAVRDLQELYAASCDGSGAWRTVAGALALVRGGAGAGAGPCSCNLCAAAKTKVAL